MHEIFYENRSTIQISQNVAQYANITTFLKIMAAFAKLATKIAIGEQIVRQQAVENQRASPMKVPRLLKLHNIGFFLKFPLQSHFCKHDTSSGMTFIFYHHAVFTFCWKKIESQGDPKDYFATRFAVAYASFEVISRQCKGDWTMPQHENSNPNLLAEGHSTKQSRLKLQHTTNSPSSTSSVERQKRPRKPAYALISPRRIRRFLRIITNARDRAFSLHLVNGCSNPMDAKVSHVKAIIDTTSNVWQSPHYLLEKRVLGIKHGDKSFVLKTTTGTNSGLDDKVFVSMLGTQ